MKETVLDTEAALRERVKELTCLYSISKIEEQQGLSIGEIAEKVVNLLPPSWQYPELAFGRINIDDTTYTAGTIVQKGPRLTSNIIVGGKKRGELFIERKQAEAEKKHLQEQIRHADRLATIGQLSAGIAHELNEPLNNIIGYAQLALNNTDISSQVHEDIEKIKKAALYSREVMRKLFFFARQMPPKKLKVDLNEVVQEGLDFLGSQAVNHEITIDYRPAEPLPEITADSSQITQVVVNIAVNAIQAMAEGGVLTVMTRTDANSVYLTVEDTGTGIDDRIRDKIFLPFFTTKDVNAGTGLGLAVVHGIVTAHGGTISVSSRKGRGSKFEVKLPIRSKEI